MDAPIVKFNSVINSLNDTENKINITFQQCYEMIQDVISHSSDKQEDLVKLKMCLTLLAQSKKEVSSLAHAAMEISCLADRSKMTKEETVQRFEQLLIELLDDEIDENQNQIISSLESYMQNKRAEEDEDIDSELLVTKATQSYKDPLTQRIMEDPVKSKVCNHAYERTSIMEYLSFSSKRCPYYGCKSMLRKEDLVDHFLLKMHLLEPLTDRHIEIPCNPENIQAEREHEDNSNNSLEVENQADENLQAAKNFELLQEMENTALVLNTVKFTCPVCFDEFDSGQGAVLHDCLHMFCRTCLINSVVHEEGVLVKCPYLDDDYSCESFLQQREIKALVSEEVYEKYLQRSIMTAESLAERSFHCKTPNCPGWCIFDNESNVFHCPVCFHSNCLNCQAIHEGLNCQQYQNNLKDDENTAKTLDFLNKMIESGKALKCPKCELILMKRSGCDWLQCSICRTEICWITKGPRWGPRKRHRSELEAGEYCSESTEISPNFFEASDVISLITDMKDVISAMNNLVEKDFKIVEAQTDEEVCNILGNIIEEVERNNIVSEVTNVSEISSVLYNIVAEVIKSAEVFDILNNIVTEVTCQAEVSDVLNNIVADVIRKVDVSDIMNNIVSDVNRRADVSVLLKNIVADVMRKTDVADVLNIIVAEVTRKADASCVLNDMLVDVIRKVDVSDVLNNIVAEVRNRADIFNVLNNIVAEVRNRAEISDILDNIVLEVKNRADISNILNNIVFEINSRAEISVILNNIVSEVKNKAEIFDILNNIVADVDRKDIYDILSNIVEKVRNESEISDVLNNIVSEVKNKVEISDVLNNIVAEVRTENEAEICNVLSNVVTDVGNRTESGVKIANVLNNIVAEVRYGNAVEISSVLNNIVAEVSTSLRSKNLENTSEIFVENDLASEMVLECPIKNVKPMEDTLLNSMDVEIYTNQVHDNFMFENKHSAAGHDKVSYTENLVEKSKCDESLTDFQMGHGDTTGGCQCRVNGVRCHPSCTTCH